MKPSTNPIKGETCYYSELTGTIIDIIHGDGLGTWGKKTLEETREDYPDAVIMDLDDAIEASDARYITKPICITREAFDDALNVLPPVDWQNTSGMETFKMSEQLSGNITGIYCRIGKEHYCLNDQMTMSREDIYKACAARRADRKGYPIYQRMVDAGIEIDNHESDLYVPQNEDTQAIMLAADVRMVTFRSDEGVICYDIPFAYLPYWEARKDQANG